MAETTDYLKALALKADDEQSVKVAAALNEKDGKIVGLMQEVSDLKAKLAEADQLNSRIADLEKRDRQRDIDVILGKAVENGQVLPAEKEAMAELFAENVQGLRTLIATRPAGAFGRKSLGHGRDLDRYADDVEVSELVKNETGAIDGVPVPVDTESAKAHVRAEKLLAEQGVKESDPDYMKHYIAAVEKAERELATA